jgi:hypothetical protein
MRCGARRDVLRYRPEVAKSAASCTPEGAVSWSLSHRSLVLVQVASLLFDESPVRECSSACLIQPKTHQHNTSSRLECASLLTTPLTISNGHIAVLLYYHHHSTTITIINNCQFSIYAEQPPALYSTCGSAALTVWRTQLEYPAISFLWSLLSGEREKLESDGPRHFSPPQLS